MSNKQSQTLNVPNRNLDDILQQSSDLGGYVAKNKVLISSVVAVIVIAAASYGVLTIQKENLRQDVDQISLNIEATDYKSWTEGKSTQDAFIQKLSKTLEENKYDVTFTPLLLKVADKLRADKAHQQVVDLLTPVVDNSSSRSVSSFLLTQHIVAALEDKGDYQEAAQKLEKLNQSGNTFMSAKVYLDLGRLYLKLGDKQKAQTNFDFLVKNYPKDELTKVAKLYLAEL